MLFSNTNTLTASEDVSGHYFFSPGVEYDDTFLINTLGLTQLSYYQTFFSTWTDYLILSSVFSSTPALFNGPFSNSTSLKDQHMSFTRNSNVSITNSSTGTIVQFLFPINALSLGPVSNLFFRFLTVDRDGKQGNIEDIIAATDSISITEGEVKTSLAQSIHNTASAAARIVSWRVEIL